MEEPGPYRDGPWAGDRGLVLATLLLLLPDQGPVQLLL